MTDGFSPREHRLAQELYEHDMGLHQAEEMPWKDQNAPIRLHYLRLAHKVVNSRWFAEEVGKARYEGSRYRYNQDS